MVVEQPLFNRDNDLFFHLASHLDRDELRRVKVDGLVDGGHDAVFDQALHNLGGGLLHAGGQLADGDLIRDLNHELCLFRDLKLKPAHLLLLLGAGLRAELSRLLLALVVLAVDLLLAALIVLHALRDEGVDAVVIAVGIDGDGRGVDDAALALALRLLRLGGLLRLSAARGHALLLVPGIRLRTRRALRGALRVLSGCGSGRRAGRRSGRLQALSGRGSGSRCRGGCGFDRENLLERVDLMVSRDMIEDHVQLILGQVLGAALRLIVKLPDDLDDLFGRHFQIVGDFLDLLLDFNTQYSHLLLFLPMFDVVPVGLLFLPAFLHAHGLARQLL